MGQQIRNLRHQILSDDQPLSYEMANTISKAMRLNFGYKA